MSYKKKNSDKIYEATQTAVALSNVNIYQHGDVSVPAGSWLVTLEGNLVECPSDEGFKENYTETKPTKINATGNKISESGKEV